MLDPAITRFFADRKEVWLKKNIKASMEEQRARELKVECEELFSLEKWLPNAAKRAGQISMATHPCTFSHPSARKNKNGYVRSIIADIAPANDGFLKTGNVATETDALGNAAALDVYKFLTLEMNDGQPLLEHIQQDSELATSTLKIGSASYQDLKGQFLAMVDSEGENITSSKIKQVFFPVEKGYHQLSILTNSGLIYQLRKRLDHLRFSDEVKALRDIKRKNEYTEQGFAEIYNLTTIGYGGTKPQNISVLNNQHGGKTHLLMSKPPPLIKRDISFPNADFFSQSIRFSQCRDIFLKLHQFYLKDKNNMHVRERRDKYYQAIIDRIINTMWDIRLVSQTQYNKEHNHLNQAQEIWLLDEYKEFREQEDDWIDHIIDAVSQFVFHGYEKVLAKKAIKFGEGEYKHMAKIVADNKEAFR